MDKSKRDEDEYSASSHSGNENEEIDSDDIKKGKSLGDRMKDILQIYYQTIVELQDYFDTKVNFDIDRSSKDEKASENSKIEKYTDTIKKSWEYIMNNMKEYHIKEPEKNSRFEDFSDVSASKTLPEHWLENLSSSNWIDSLIKLHRLYK